jgi:hypothetical protein
MKYKIGDKVISNLGESRGQKAVVVGMSGDDYIVKGFTWGSKYGEDCHLYSEAYLDPIPRSKNEILLTQILNNN